MYNTSHTVLRCELKIIFQESDTRWEAYPSTIISEIIYTKLIRVFVNCLYVIPDVVSCYRYMMHKSFQAKVRFNIRNLWPIIYSSGCFKLLNKLFLGIFVAI